MSIDRVFKILWRNLHQGPRSPLFLFAIFIPLLMTFLIQVVFGPLFEPSPRLGIVDFGNSEITESAEELEGIEVIILEDVDELKIQVERNDLDVGFVLQEGFDEDIRLGKNPELEFFISGESLASDRIILSVTMIDLIREVEGLDSLVEIEVIALGEERLPMTERLVPLIMFYALFVAGVFVPAMSIVEEREEGTLRAMLVTPVRMSEILLAKSILGFMIAVIITLLTLVINNALGTEPLALLLALLVSIFMIIEIGIIFATLSKDVKSLYTFIKSAGFLLIAPAIFYIWPDFPLWIAKIFPTYWMIDPIYRIGVEGAGLADIWTDILIAFGICIALLPIVVILGRRMEKTLSF
jgi:ABC-2 type transport system permease protein